MANLIEQMNKLKVEQTPSMQLIQKHLLEFKKIQDQFIPLFPEKLIERSLEMKSSSFKNFVKDWGWLVNKKDANFGDYCYGLYKIQGEEKFKDKINRWFYHKKHLNIVLKDLKDVFPESRIKIIKNGMEFHQKKNYSCSISLLLPQVEGLLWDLAVKKKMVRRAYNSKKKKDGSGKWDLQDLSKTIFPKDKFHKIIVNEIFVQGFRNSVLHGRNIHLGKEKEITRWRSTLLILTLWRLSDEF